MIQGTECTKSNDYQLDTEEDNEAGTLARDIVAIEISHGV